MYIRQTTLFSFEQIMEFQQETKLELILNQIDVSKLVAFQGKPNFQKHDHSECATVHKSTGKSSV